MIVNIELTVYPYRDMNGAKTTAHETEGVATPWNDLSPEHQRLAIRAVREYINGLERSIGKGVRHD